MFIDPVQRLDIEIAYALSSRLRVALHGVRECEVWTTPSSATTREDMLAEAYPRGGMTIRCTPLDEGLQ